MLLTRTEYSKYSEQPSVQIGLKPRPDIENPEKCSKETLVENVLLVHTLSSGVALLASNVSKTLSEKEEQRST